MINSAEMRKIFKKHHDRVAEEMSNRQQKTGKSESEVLAEDPFLAGQAYVLGMIGIDILIQE